MLNCLLNNCFNLYFVRFVFNDYLTIWKDTLLVYIFCVNNNSSNRLFTSPIRRKEPHLAFMCFQRNEFVCQNYLFDAFHSLIVIHCKWKNIYVEWKCFANFNAKIVFIYLFIFYFVSSSGHKISLTLTYNTPTTSRRFIF